MKRLRLIHVSRDCPVLLSQVETWTAVVQHYCRLVVETRCVWHRSICEHSWHTQCGRLYCAYTMTKNLQRHLQPMNTMQPARTAETVCKNFTKLTTPEGILRRTNAKTCKDRLNFAFNFWIFLCFTKTVSTFYINIFNTNIRINMWFTTVSIWQLWCSMWLKCMWMRHSDVNPYITFSWNPQSVSGTTFLLSICHHSDHQCYFIW